MYVFLLPYLDVVYAHLVTQREPSLQWNIGLKYPVLDNLDPVSLYD